MVYTVGTTVLTEDNKIYVLVQILRMLLHGAYKLCRTFWFLFNVLLYCTAISNSDKKMKTLALWTTKSDVSPYGTCCQAIFERVSILILYYKFSKISS
jgi:cytidine deaminase